MQNLHVDELLQSGIRQTVDVHGVPADKMAEGLNFLCLAFRVPAHQDNRPVFLYQFRISPTDRTL